MLQQRAVIPPPEKPKEGYLYYGGRRIFGPEPFFKLGVRQKQMIAQGYDPKLFSKHYR